MPVTTDTKSTPTLQTLPGDDLRQLMWRFADRYEFHMLVQSARGVARGPVARLVAAGGRNSHEWTPEKNSLLQHYDESGITAAFLDPELGGFVAGPTQIPALPNERIVELQTTRLETGLSASTPTSFQL